MQVDAAVKCVLLGVESQEGSSFLASAVSPYQHITGYAGEGASISINALQLTAYSLRSYVAPAFGSSSGLASAMTANVKSGQQIVLGLQDFFVRRASATPEPGRNAG
jgi:hypothetical protein